VDDPRRTVEVRRRHVVHLDPLLGLEEASRRPLRILGAAPEAGAAAERDLSAHGGRLCHTRGPRVAGSALARRAARSTHAPASTSRAEPRPQADADRPFDAFPAPMDAICAEEGVGALPARSQAARACAASRSTLGRRRIRSSQLRRRRAFLRNRFPEVGEAGHVRHQRDVGARELADEPVARPRAAPRARPVAPHRGGQRPRRLGMLGPELRAPDR
jgi:hypothetical protein